MRLASTPSLGKSCSGVGPSVSGKLPTFTRSTLLDLAGVGYITPVDLNDDGYPELLASTLAEELDFSMGVPPLSYGGGYVLSRAGGEGVGTWRADKIFDKDSRFELNGEMRGISWPNSSELIDLDNDGIKDWIIGAGFLSKPYGSLPWMKGSRDGKFSSPRFIPVPDPTCWYHIPLPIDMDGDGDEDFATSCHVGSVQDMFGPSRLEWFENPGDDSGNFTVHAIGDGGGNFISQFDVDEDGDTDLIAPEYWGPDTLVWYEQTGAKGSAWVRHVISNSHGRGFITHIADMNGDGRRDILFGNHNNEDAEREQDRTMGIYWFSIPPKDEVRGLSTWDAYVHTVYEGFEVAGEANAKTDAAPGMLNVGDIDGDCDLDVSVSGDGDVGMYLFVQQADGFEKVELLYDPAFATAGEQHFFDMDRDGDQDLVWATFGPLPKITSPTITSAVLVFAQD